MSKKSRRTSSDNVSTPASDRSRSPSIMSTGDEQDEVLVEEHQMQMEAGRSDIDKILELVHELKQKDLEEYKRKINLKNKETTEDKRKSQDKRSNSNSEEMLKSDKNFKELADDSFDIMDDNMNSEKYDATDSRLNLSENLNTTFEVKEQDGGLTVQKKSNKKKHANEITEDKNDEKVNSSIIEHDLHGDSNLHSSNFDVEPPKLLYFGEFANITKCKQ